MKILDIELALIKEFNPRVNICVPNISWGMNLHECDLLILSVAGYATEIEIKTSRVDLIKDQKKKHQHSSDRIKQLYFAIPKKLEKDVGFIPEKAGIIVISELPGVRAHKGYSCHYFRVAPVNINARPFTIEERYNLARLGTMRIWTLKKTIQHLRDEANVNKNTNSIDKGK